MKATDAQLIQALRKELTDHSFFYYTLGSPSISDQEYDAKFKSLLALEADHPELYDSSSPTLRVGARTPTSLKTVKHKVQMLSLENVNSVSETMAFFKSHHGAEVILEMKIDGLSLHLSYKKGSLVQAITRGNGFTGDDVTENARTIRTIPLKLLSPVDIEVRGEAYWRISKFNRFNSSQQESDRIANPRNGAAGSLRQKDSKEVARRHLDFVAYTIPSTPPDGVATQCDVLSYLESLGFLTPTTLQVVRDMPGLPYTVISLTPDDLSAGIAYMDDYRKALDLDTDGVVIKISSLAAQDDIGAGTRAPKWAAAYKFPPEVKTTCLIGVTVQVGKTGQVTPVAQLEPVALGGTIVQRASLCNQDELDRLGIDIGDYVFVQRSGEVIPKIVGLARPSPTKSDPNRSYKLPKTCPCCSEPLVRPEGMVHSYCPNIACRDQVFARMVYAVGKDALDIDGCGESAVRALMEQKVYKLSDIYALKDLSFLKPATARKLKEGLDKAKTAPLWRKLAALSIEDIGKTTSQDLAQKYGSVAAMVADMAGVTDLIGDVATSSFFSFVEREMEEFEHLAEAGFFFEEDKAAAGPLSGKSFCITGKLMSGKRDGVAETIQKYGGMVKSQVTKKVDFLIQGIGGGANKAADSSKLGTRLISEEELYAMIGIPMPLGDMPPEDARENILK